MEIQCMSNDTLFICPSIYNVFFRAYCSVNLKFLIKVLFSVLKPVLYNVKTGLFVLFNVVYLYITNGHLF